MQTRLFISYRRADSRTFTNRIYDRLVAAFGKDTIFKDVDSIPYGEDFREVVLQATSSCRVMLVIIGPKWLTTTDDDGTRRLDHPDDFVHVEIETGLQRPAIKMIPILIDGASMPSASELPHSLQPLVYKNAHFIRDDPDFHKDVDRLIRGLRPVINGGRTRTLRYSAGLLILLALVVVIGVAASSLLSRFQTPSPELLTLVPTLTDTETPTNGAMPSDMPPVMPPLIVLPTENPPVTIPLSPTHSPMPTLLDPQGTLASGLTATQVAAH